MTDRRKLKAIMANIVDEGLPEHPAPAAPPRARVRLPLVENAHSAEPDDEMTPERVAAILEREEVASRSS